MTQNKEALDALERLHNEALAAKDGYLLPDDYNTIKAALQSPAVDVEGLKREADAAYCTALNLAEKHCRGSQYKLENGKFTSDDLKWHCQHNERIGYHRGMCRVLKEVNHIAAQGVIGVQDGWIKTSDRLPEKPNLKSYEYVDCLIYHDGEIKTRPWNCEHLCWDDEDYDDHYCDALEPTHWMPLPDAPKGE